MLDNQAVYYYITFTKEELLEGTTEIEEEIDWGIPMGEEVW